MKSVLLWFLVVVNVLLLAAIVGRFTRGDVANAQIQPQHRVSDYLMAPTELSNGQAGIVCIIDENSGQMAAVAYNGRNGLDVMTPLDLERGAAPGARGYNNGTGR